jgi:serine/threonine-protein kinase
MTGALQAEQMLVGRYRVVRLLARGGMGAVYQAEDTRLGGVPVAVKEMSSSFVRGDTEAFERAVADFRREAAMLARLRHPHLPRVSDQFDERGKYYLVMEFIAGHTLLEGLRRAGGHLPSDMALDFAGQLCDVLSYLHAQNPPIIYRDLKPSNVMIMEDGPSGTGDGSDIARSATLSRSVHPHLVLIDFGIARFYRPGQAGDTAIYGTTGYAPPEQYGDSQTDPRTDIYALGVLLHQLLTGHDPTTTPFALPPPRVLNPAIPPHIASAIVRATAVDRQARFSDIASFRTALRDLPAPEQAAVRRASQPSAASPIARVAPPTGRATSRLTWALVGLAGLLLIAAMVVLLLLWPAQRVGRVVPKPVVSTGSVPTRTPRLPPAEAATVVPAGTPAADTGSDSITPQPIGPGNRVVVLRPNSISASSFAPPGIDSQKNPVSYEPENAIDSRPDTAWRVAGDGVNTWIELTFEQDIAVMSIGLIPGYDKIDSADGTDRFFQSRVVKTARFEFSDGSMARVDFKRERTLQIASFSGIRTRSIRIVIEATYPPPPAAEGGRDFTPISEIQVQGTT